MLKAILLTPQNRRILLSVLLLTVLAAIFWSSSRYPALDEKAMMSGALQLEDPLSFEAILPLAPSDPLITKILYTTINWLETNRVGMTFGVVFAAGFLTLLGYLNRTSFQGSFANSLLGMIIGAPLGVCVNCAAPIARGLFRGGARVETTLAAMIASPTLNVVVITMLISLVPLYLVVIKLGLSVLLMLVVIPIISRYLSPTERQTETLVTPIQSYQLQLGKRQNEHLISTLQEFTKDYLRNLWRIALATVPLMLLAGLLGSIAATLMPPELLAKQAFSLPVLLLVCIAGAFAPVPIGFDVVVSASLLNAGLPIGYVMALLFTLGIFSVYSFSIVAATISLRTGFLMFISVVSLGLFAGVSAQYYHQRQTNQALELLTSQSSKNMIAPVIAAADESNDVVEQNPIHTNHLSVSEIEWIATPFKERQITGTTAFTAKEAWHLGIDKPIEFSFADMWPPFWEGRSVSTGDIDNDGDKDVILASTKKGLYIYKNNGSGQFSTYEHSLDEVRDIPVFNAALVDINNDGWLDLFVTSYQQGNFWVANDNGKFSFSDQHTVKNREDAILSLALTFADVDADGDLDVALGNWAAGWYRRIPGEESRNRVVYNDNGNLTGEQAVELPAPPGETLSILFTDFNSDGKTDLIVGNDFELPDVFYTGDGSGQFELIERKHGIIPHSTTTTMSVKTADLLNRGLTDIYTAQISGRSSGVSKRLKMQAIGDYCKSIEREEDIKLCQQNIDIKAWYRSGNSFNPAYADRCLSLDDVNRQECRGMLVKDLAIQKNNSSVCKLIPAGQQRARQYCDIHFKPARAMTAHEHETSIPQIKGRNNLLLAGESGQFNDQTEHYGLDIGGWSWDVKIADFNNDQWQDIYIVNGTWVPNEVTPSNMFYLNQQGKQFVEDAASSGLEDYLLTAAASQFDLEGDGDLDLITVPINGPLKVFINNNVQGESIAFRFSDAIGNHFGIGARIEIQYGSGLLQTRELQSGGGFMSFDAPEVYFGLGDHTQIDKVTIRWADGAVSHVNEPLYSGSIYQIIRKEAE